MTLRDLHVAQWPTCVRVLTVHGHGTEVESHPFELDTMLFMDWRDEHTHANPAMRASNEALPTFLYAMPYTKNK